MSHSAVTHHRVPIQVLPYSLPALRKLLVDAGHAMASSYIDRKHHIEYFREYFTHFTSKAKGDVTIVVESHYTDRDFLEDYAAYYVRGFEGKYSSICTRLHFFQGGFTREDLEAVVLGQRDVESLGDYIGFVVARPLPSAVIGRTCLKTYDDDGGRRHYPVIREYEVHLLGLDFTVQSIAFQEQDTVAAACATSALWSTFQRTGKLFQHPIPSPVEVTRTATEQLPGLRRAFPNKGLNTLQISGAVKRIGLEPEVAGFSSEAVLQATAYAFLRARIPVILMCGLYDVSDPDKPKFYKDRPEAGHAVAIMGYSLGSKASIPYPDKLGTLLESSRIDELYVHDDQVGPFARLRFGGPKLDLSHLDELGSQSKNVELTMESSWRAPGTDAKPGSVCFAPETLVIPLYHKIRIPLDPILEKLFIVDEQFEKLRRAGTLNLGGRLEWEVYLQNGSDLKRDFRDNGLSRGLDRGTLMGLLERPHPRFVWRATASVNGRPVLEVIYDATDIEQGDYLLDFIWYDKKVVADLPAQSQE